ncbi:MAG: PAS domain S-box protein [Alphaproteobacteria bacterium]|nr:PAS domain S-box protein [Alphaproteobacteria bacterium]
MTKLTQPASAPTDTSSPAFFRALVEGVPEAIIVTMPDGTITYFNPASEKLLGYAQADVVGRNIVMLVPQQPDRRADAVKWLERWAHEPDETQSRFLDFIAQTKAGAQMPVDVRVVERKINGERRYLITFRDNTARRKEQAAFRQAHLRASRILQIAEDGIVSADASQTITFFNLKAEEIFGYRAEEVVGRPLSLLMPERYRTRHAGDMERFAAGKQASRQMNERGGVLGVRKNGEEFPLEVAITKVSVGGALTFTAHMRDITRRKQREEKLRESERRFRAIFDHAFEAIGLLAPDGTVLEINRAGRMMTEGGSALIGLPLWDLPWAGSDLTADDSARQRLRSAVARAAAGEPVRYTADLQRAEGDVRKIDISLTPIRDEAGKVIYIVPEGRDTPPGD